MIDVFSTAPSRRRRPAAERSFLGSGFLILEREMLRGLAPIFLTSFSPGAR